MLESLEEFLIQLCILLGFKETVCFFLILTWFNQLVALDKTLLNKLSTYRCGSPKLLPVSSAESSVSVGLYFRTRKEFLEFEEKLKENEEILHGIISVKDNFENFENQESESEEDYYLV